MKMKMKIQDSEIKVETSRIFFSKYLDFILEILDSIFNNRPPSQSTIQTTPGLMKMTSDHSDIRH